MFAANGSSMACRSSSQTAIQHRWMLFVDDYRYQRVRSVGQTSNLLLTLHQGPCKCVTGCETASTELPSSAGVIHNGQNERLKNGLEALPGVHCGEIPRSALAAILLSETLDDVHLLIMQNTYQCLCTAPSRNCSDRQCSGFCTFGCSSGSKKVDMKKSRQNHLLSRFSNDVEALCL